MPVSTTARLERPAPLKGPVLFIGLDVHNDSIAVSLAPSDATEVRRYGIIGGEHDDMLKLATKLAAAHPGMLLKFGYESGPCGFGLARQLQAWGVSVLVIRPMKLDSLGKGVNTDKTDAAKLVSRLDRYLAGNRKAFAIVRVPAPEEEQRRCVSRQSDTDARAVVIGAMGNAWTYDLLNNVFRLVMNGAELVALHRNKFWPTDAGLQMDIGAAQELGMLGILAKTGKYRDTYVQASKIRPDLVLDSFANLDERL